VLSREHSTDHVTVTDMLVAVLNCCSKEELEEAEEEELVSPASTTEDPSERRKVIKNKIMAVGRMARVFALLRYVSFFLPMCYRSNFFLLQ
jgi:hypothetical protein